MKQPAKVLVIEDDETLREVLTDVLTARGLDVVASARGDKAVEIARQEHFDLIIADIRMEGMNGLDAIEKAREFQPDIGSIVVSGFASEEETLRAVRLNVAGYLKKPFQVPELMELINSYLTQREQRQLREKEQRGLSEALFWSFEQQGFWAEKSTTKPILRPARLASMLAQELGLSPEMARQVFLGTVLRQLAQLGAEKPGEEAKEALRVYPALTSSWDSQEPDGPTEFALAVCEGLESDDDWPEPDRLSVESPAILGAYERVIKRESRESSDENVEEPKASHAPAGLLALARTLEHGGDLEGAKTGFARVAMEGGVTPLALAALLGLARVAVAQGEIPTLEKSMSELLSQAEKLGPVTFALAELEGAKILHRAGHPATQKLFHRSCQSLSRVNLTLPWATATVSLASLSSTVDNAAFERAIEVLSMPLHRQEVIEQLDALIPALLAVEQTPAVDALSLSLVRDFPYEVVSHLAGNRLDLGARTHLVGLLERHGASVPEALLDWLARDPDAEIRSRGVALQAELGRSEAIPVLRVYSLGQLDVTLGERPIDDRVWKTQKTRHLFALLADHWPRALSAERLMADFWPESDQASARNNLNAAVSTVRKILRSTQKGFDPLLRSGDTLGLNPEQPFWHDVAELERAAEEGRRSLEQGNVETAMSHLSRVVRLYRGPYLEGVYMDWVSQRQLALENIAINALAKLADHRANQHRYREALECALQLLVLQPEHSRAHEVIMSSYRGLDQHEKAVTHFETYQTRLEQDLDEESLVGLTKLYQMARYGFAQEPGFKADV